ncbi:Phytoene dehydrogenase-related protein [Cryobacterium flavum]|uniref:Pyridine nucleotide-disulfide oxidoreductase domain-containing protein 2 n=1 Tax=Cryobacterium flavum TaxID=1424659 RepID=A0A4R8VHR8_9MICO|nr:NAD(P)/FAD-dependent oxidoreductase [Cryobacterium flavum]TFB81437.1 NAD(P)/FAD-dependent oxidoreductase [Cryobacterium flavum]SDO40100.1 Phytoene dehydrogenase-related protein [Cryobacterium flavum]
MTTDQGLDAIVVGSGPNGLAAAVTLARAGLRVRVYERNAQIGGGAATAELTLPGFHHDVGSAVHPLALASEFFQKFGLKDRIELTVPEISYGHPLPGGRAGVAWHDIERTAAGLGRDGPAWLQLLNPLVDNISEVAELTGDSLLRVPRHPLTLARFGLRTLEQGGPAWNWRFTGDTAPALLTGTFAHSIGRLPSPSTAGAGLVLAAHAHAGGWPIPTGGSGAIVQALADDLLAHGGEIITDADIHKLTDLPPARIVLLDVTPRALVELAAGALPDRYTTTLSRFRYGNAVAKVDFALNEPVPWSADDLRRAPTLHVGGTRADQARAENAVARGQHSDSPYVLASQPSIIDPSRAPEGKHVLWAYTHVPAGSTRDQTEQITRQIERFAPGFRDTILTTASQTAAQMQNHNPNHIGGDIAAGAISLAQLVRRPVLSPDPWRTPLDGVYLCSSSTAPGPGVHGMCGYRAALSALAHEYNILTPPDLAPPAQ